MDDILEGDVLVQKNERIHVITLNRPDSLNAITTGMHHAIEDAFRDADRDPGSDVIVVTGAGRGFCSGGDMKATQKAGRAGWKTDRPRVQSPGRSLLFTLLGLEKPTIAIVNGPAIGLGATIALSMDCIVMAESACIADSHIDIGAVAGDGGAILWPALIGPHRAKEFLMTGRRMYGPEAGATGLVNHVYPDNQVVEEGFAIAKVLAAKAPYALRATKIIINRNIIRQAFELHDLAIAYEHNSFRKDDYKEAMSAHVEHREPKFTGR